MLVQERHNIILRMLEEKKLVKVNNLVEKFGVSIETIRRDLDCLEEKGYAKRVYGGAVFVKNTSAEPKYAIREIENLEEKKAIAIKAVEFINDGDTVAIDIGTTTLEVARCLMKKRNLTVLTNSIKAAVELSKKKDFTVVLLGGIVRGEEEACSGYITDSILKQFNVTTSIIGVGGITIRKGITDYHMQEAHTRQIMIERGETIIAVADYSKFEVNAFMKVASINKIDIIISDWHLDKEHIKEYQNENIKVVIANK